MSPRPARLHHLRGMWDQQVCRSAYSVPSFVRISSSGLWSKLRLVQKPGLVQFDALCFFRLRSPLGIPLRRFLGVEPLRLLDGALHRRFQPLEDTNQPEARAVPGANQIEAVLRVLPLRENLSPIAV